MFYWLKNRIQMVLLDLDGTLLNNNKKIGDSDFKTLELLGRSGIIRVFATGRNLYSSLNIIPEFCPIDYLVFSSGAGVYNWKTREIIFQSAITSKTVIEIERILRNLNLNFSIHFPIPDNHKYFYYKGNSENSDFDQRNLLYSDFSIKSAGSYPFDFACQFLIILNNESEISIITKQINGLKTIRATSPIDGKSVWLEIFNKNVSKALGGKFLCDLLNISHEKTLSIGNDYNDIDLLDWTSHSFIVSNAPQPIRHKYTQCTDNHNNPLTDVIKKLEIQFF